VYYLLRTGEKALMVSFRSETAAKCSLAQELCSQQGVEDLKFEV
jgi:hypothetical protein